MALTYAPNCSKLVYNTAGAVQSLPDESFGGKTRNQIERYAMAGNAIADQVMVARLPYGSIPVSIMVTGTVSIGTGTTLAFGDRNNASRFGAAGALATLNVPTEFLTSASVRGLALTSCWAQDSTGTSATSNTNYEDILMTIGTSSLGATGTLVIETKYLEYNS